MQEVQSGNSAFLRSRGSVTPTNGANPGSHGMMINAEFITNIRNSCSADMVAPCGHDPSQAIVQAVNILGKE